MNHQNHQQDNSTEKQQGGCVRSIVSLIVASFGAMTVGAGMCVGRFSVPIDSTPMFEAMWLGVSFIVVMIIFILILKNF